MTEKYVLENGVIKDTTNNITFHDFGDILILINGQSRHLTELSEENEQLKEHQKTLEAKIVRLKDRVKTFEKHYSLKDIERYKKMENCNCITAKRLEE